jgi:hypothetical protein
MVSKGDLADMMVQIAPEVYRKYITRDKKGTKIHKDTLRETPESALWTNVSKPALL